MPGEPAFFVSENCLSGEGKRGRGRGEKEKEGRSEERGREARILGNQVSPQQAAGAAASPLLRIPQEDHALGY